LTLLQNNIGEAFKDTDMDKDFLNRTPIAQKIRERIDKWDCIKLKGFAQQKKQSTE
jgi:hypothetical protein